MTYPPSRPPYEPDPYGQQQPPPGYQPRPQRQPYPPQQSFQQPGQPPWPRPPQVRTARRSHTVRNVLLSMAGALMVLAVVSIALNGGGTGSPHKRAGSAINSAPAVSTRHSAAGHTPAPAPVRPHVIARFTGSGIENTPRFRTPGTWLLRWSYNCASFGQSGNFAVLEDGGVGGVAVNELGLNGHGKTYGYGDAGRHYLEVDSECHWSVKVVG